MDNSHHLFEDPKYNDDYTELLYPYISKGVCVGFYDAGKLNGTYALRISENNIEEMFKRVISYGSKYYLRCQAEIFDHSMTEMKAFFTSGFNTLKIRSIVLRLHFEYLQKKADHCNVISYK